MELTPEYLKIEYIDKKRSAVEISAELNIDVRTIYRRLKKVGISRRSLKEARSLLVEKRKVSPVKYNCRPRRPISLPVVVGAGQIKATQVERIELDAHINAIVADMEPLEDLLTGLRLNYDILVARKAQMTTSFVEALDSIAAEG